MTIKIFGSFRDGDVGDEAMIIALSDLASAAGVSLDAMATTASCHSENYATLCKAEAAPTLAVGGEMVAPSFHSALLRGRHKLKKPLAFFSIGTEPGTHFWPWHYLPTRRLLAKASDVSARDTLSATNLRRFLGYTPQVVGDLRLSLKAGEKLPDELNGIETYIAVAPSPWWRKEPAWHPWISEGLVALAKQLDATLVFVPTSTGELDDRPEAKFIASHVNGRDKKVKTIVLDQPLDARTYAAVLKNAMLTVSMRLAASVISYGQETPVISLLTHAKLYGFAQTVGCEDYVVPNITMSPRTALAYGYNLFETPLLDTNLAKAGVKAAKEMTFDRLEPLRAQQVERLTDISSSLQD